MHLKIPTSGFKGQKTSIFSPHELDQDGKLIVDGLKRTECLGFSQYYELLIYVEKRVFTRPASQNDPKILKPM
jgi:hypothetical protein